jgi:hypothetical protein
MVQSPQSPKPDDGVIDSQPPREVLLRVIDSFEDPNKIQPASKKRDRLLSVDIATGMFPHSTRELNIAHALIDAYKNDPIRYLTAAKAAERAKERLSIYDGNTPQASDDENHQQPSERIMFNLVRELVGYHTDASTHIVALNKLKTQLSADIDKKVESTQLIDEWQNDEDLRLAVGTILRHYDTDSFEVGLGDDMSDLDYYDGEEVLRREHYTIKDLKVSELLDAVDLVLKFEHNRLKFWGEQLLGRSENVAEGITKLKGIVDIQSPEMQEELLRLFLAANEDKKGL